MTVRREHRVNTPNGSITNHALDSLYDIERAFGEDYIPILDDNPPAVAARLRAYAAGLPEGGE